MTTTENIRQLVKEREEALEAAYAVVKVRARLVHAGDVIRQKDGTLAMVQWASQEPGHDAPAGKVKLLLQRGIYAADAVNVPAEHGVPVLMSLAERTALGLLRSQLGAQVIDRRSE